MSCFRIVVLVGPLGVITAAREREERGGEERQNRLSLSRSPSFSIIFEAASLSLQQYLIIDTDRDRRRAHDSTVLKLKTLSIFTEGLHFFGHFHSDLFCVILPDSLREDQQIHDPNCGHVIIELATTTIFLSPHNFSKLLWDVTHSSQSDMRDNAARWGADITVPLFLSA